MKMVVLYYCPDVSTCLFKSIEWHDLVWHLVTKHYWTFEYASRTPKLERIDV